MAIVVLRPALATDLAAIQTTVAAAYQVYVPRIGRRPAPMDADYADAVASGQVWVAVADGGVIGLVVLVPAGDHLLVDAVAVSPAAQGLGVGRRLLALAEEQARARGLGEVRLYTNEAMTENLTYYPRLGYVETHRAEQDGFHRVFFRKSLAG